jgi:regulator of protease activity HflC (stomatin/prohibitin superfamily)
VPLLTLLSSCYTIDQTQRGILKKFGAIVSIEEPGVHFAAPIINSIIKIDVSTRKEMVDLDVYSRDIQAAKVKLAVNYRLNPGKLESIYSAYGDDVYFRAVLPVIVKAFKDAFGQYAAQDVVVKRQELGKVAEDSIRASVPDGIIIEAVQLENVDFSDAYEQAIEMAMKAEAEVKTRAQELRQMEIKTKQDILVAETEKRKTELAADAEAYMLKAKGEAEAGAIRAKGDALKETPELVNLSIAEKWNGALPTTMLPGNSVPLLPLPGK